MSCCSIHTALIRHFSRRCRRELAATDTTRVELPFASGPTTLVACWMLAGGGEPGTPAVPYPKNELQHLELLKNLAAYLEIDSLVKLITKDIAALTAAPPPLPATNSEPNPTPTMAALTPAPPRLPATNSGPNSTTKIAAPVGRRCWYCHKAG